MTTLTSEQEFLIDRIQNEFSAELVGLPQIADANDSDDRLLAAQTRSMLIEALHFAAVGRSTPNPLSVVYSLDEEQRETGTEAAARLEHPAVPLMLAEVLFDVALPMLVEHFAERIDAVDVSRSLHRAIWRRFPQGAIAYTSALREQLLTSAVDARIGVARELHDRVAPSLLVAIRVWESSETGAITTQPLTALREALAEVQDLATNLRTSLDGRTLSQALSDYCFEESTSDVPVAVTITGHPQPVRHELAEELFAITREAVRNAAAHAAGASRIDVRCAWEPASVRITVVDDGAGISAKGSRTPGTGLGVVGMRERASVIGARIELQSDSGGTSVVIMLSLDSLSRHG